jgi:hypothetical protein
MNLISLSVVVVVVVVVFVVEGTNISFFHCAVS